MTFGEKLRELNSQGKTLRFVHESWQRGYVSLSDVYDGDRLLFPTSKWWHRRNVQYFIMVPSWISSQYCHRRYYRVVDLGKECVK